MVARVLRALFIAWLAALLTVLTLGRHLGWTTGVWVAMYVLLFGHPTVLALELTIARTLAPTLRVPRPRWRELLRTWLAECRASTVCFAWRMPWRANTIKDHVPSDVRGVRGVVFVHGYLCNRGIWNPWLARMRKLDRPFVAVSLEPVFASMDAHGETIERAVRRIEGCTGLAPVIVAHSMGGLVVRAWLRSRCGDASGASHQPPARIVTIGSPHAGTWMARLALSRNAREMRPGGDWLTALAAAESPQLGALFSCWWSDCDQIVYPAPTAILPGSEARLVRAGHVALAGREEIWTELRWRTDN